jgi:DNA-directed RNA polymerase specialized sigma24 family protein
MEVLPDMETERMAAVERIEVVLEASKQARQAVRQAETAYLRFARRMEAGSSVHDAFTALRVGDLRKDLNDHLEALEHARHEARRAIIALGVSEGLSLGELARMWGVSRQLVTRLANHG